MPILQPYAAVWILDYENSGSIVSGGLTKMGGTRRVMQTKLAHLGLAFLLAYEPASLKVFHIASLTKHWRNQSLTPKKEKGYSLAIL